MLQIVVFGIDHEELPCLPGLKVLFTVVVSACNLEPRRLEIAMNDGGVIDASKVSAAYFSAMP